MQTNQKYSKSISVAIWLCIAIPTLLTPNHALAQDCFPCRELFNETDSLLHMDKQMEGLMLFDSHPDCYTYASQTRHYGMSQMLHNAGEIALATKHLKLAVKKGAIWANIANGQYLRMYDYIIQLGGESLYRELMDIHHYILTHQADIELIHKLRNIEEQDQKIRNSTKYRECRRLGNKFAPKSSASQAQQDSIAACYQEFRTLNKAIIAQFVDIIDSLGYVPSDTEAFGMASIQVLVNHTSSYKFEADIDSIYLSSVMRGTLSPRVYAWYEGYKADFTDQPSKYHYCTSSEEIQELSNDKDWVKRINKNRKAIGLPMLPRTIWTRYFTPD